MKWVRSSTLVAILTVLISTAAAAVWKPEPLPRDQEIAAALEAGPAAIREEAGVYVLTAAGFELARESGNGFHCLVGRSQPDAFEPQCFDAVGSATLLEQVLMRGKLRAAGHTADEVDELVGAAWASGELRAPDRPGINYMLSERNRVPVAPDQVILCNGSDQALDVILRSLLEPGDEMVFARPGADRALGQYGGGAGERP